MDDKLIINALTANEEEGYIMMIDKYTNYVSSIVYNMTKDIISNSEMEELVADVFFKVWIRRNSLEGNSLKGLLGQITRNLCIDVFRKQKMAFIPFKEDILIYSIKDSVYAEVEKKELSSIINNTVAKFIQPDREIFIRFYYFGENQKDISKKLDINISTIKTKLQRSREKLKIILKERGYNCEEEES